LKDLEEKSDRAPRMPRSASDAIASPRGRLPNGPSAQSAPLGKGQHNYVDVPPTTETARTSSSPQIDAPPASPRNRSPSPPLSASSPSAITAASGGLGSSASSTGVGGSVPRTPRAKKAAASKGQYVDYDKFDDDRDVQQRHGNGKTPRRASDAGEKSAAGSPVGGKAKAKGSSPGGRAKALGNTDRKLMGQYVDYQEADFSGETGAEAKKAVASPKRPKKAAAADDGESNYIYGGVGNLEGGEAAQEKSGNSNSNKAPVAELSDNDSSSDDSDSDDSDAVESESESDSDDSDSEVSRYST
jgi:hypothetical protein